MDNFRRIGLEKIAEDKIPSSAIPISITDGNTVSGNVWYIPLFRNNKSYRPNSSISYHFPSYGTSTSGVFKITCEDSLVSLILIESGDFSTMWPSNVVNFGGNDLSDNFAPYIYYGVGGTNDSGAISFPSYSEYSGKIFPLDLLPLLFTATRSDSSYTQKATLSRWSGDNNYYVKLKFSAPFKFKGYSGYGTTWPHPPYVDTES